MRYFKYISAFPNLGKIDRLLRSIVALVLFTYFIGASGPSISHFIALGVSIILLLTSLVSYCPVYSIFGLKSNNKLAKQSN